ncbi:MAG: hypothetical protein AUI97_01865 [Crenarchaeota archaeon 13_1_40CM_3_52_17]|nr:MAG: hypothetical protein AUI97_01865 [Crenarchaeota archaeon 13_1_40CM_3_52_17]
MFPVSQTKSPGLLSERVVIVGYLMAFGAYLEDGWVLDPSKGRVFGAWFLLNTLETWGVFRSLQEQKKKRGRGRC